MGLSRREDRALLRSNPSARPAAETWPGASPTRGSRHAPLPCFGRDAINLRAPGAAPSTTLFPISTGAVRHMSGSSGLKKEFPPTTFVSKIGKLFSAPS